jgi:hypothetical protein
MPKFRVVSYDNNYHMDQSESTDHNVFATAQQAVAACKAIVDDDLSAMWKPGTSARELYELYLAYGQDAFVMPVKPNGPEVEFSASRYAKEKSRDLVRARGSIVRRPSK